MEWLIRRRLLLRLVVRVLRVLRMLGVVLLRLTLIENDRSRFL